MRGLALDFELSREQRMLQKGTREFMKNEIDPVSCPGPFLWRPYQSLRSEPGLKRLRQIESQVSARPDFRRTGV